MRWSTLISPLCLFVGEKTTHSFREVHSTVPTSNTEFCICNQDTMPSNRLACSTVRTEVVKVGSWAPNFQLKLSVSLGISLVKDNFNIPPQTNHWLTGKGRSCWKTGDQNCADTIGPSVQVMVCCAVSVSSVLSSRDENISHDSQELQYTVSMIVQGILTRPDRFQNPEMFCAAWHSSLGTFKADKAKAAETLHTLKMPEDVSCPPFSSRKLWDLIDHRGGQRFKRKDPFAKLENPESFLGGAGKPTYPLWNFGRSLGQQTSKLWS